MAEGKTRPDRVMLVGIGYDKESKLHRCRVEEVDVQELMKME